VGYSLGTTYIRKAEFHSIQSPTISAFLAASGYNRHFPRALVFAPRSKGGLGYVHLYLLQGQQCIRLLLRHILHQTELGKQIRIDLAWIQLEAGVSTAILTNTQNDLDYVQDGWVLGIRRFLKTVDAEIQLTEVESPQIYRQNDVYLMDIFRTQGLSTSSLSRLNRCRLYFQVARLSDITNIAGTHLYDHVLPLDREPTAANYPKYPATTLAWPRQPRPGPTARLYWSKMIRKYFLQANGRLQVPLGKWTTLVDTRDRSYPTLYHAYSHTIHQYDGHNYQQLQVQKTNRRTIIADVGSHTPSLSTPGYPIDLQHIRGSQLTAHYTPRNALLINPSRRPPHPRFGQLPDWQADLLQHTTIDNNKIHLLNNAGAMIVSNGGVEGGKGYFGVVLEVGQKIIARVRGAARGDPRTMCSFRAKVYGFLTGICLYSSLLQLAGGSQAQKNTIHTDSASLLSRLNNATATKVPVGFWLKSDSDIVRQIVAEARKVQHLARIYVKGHQDAVKKTKDLTQPEFFNIDADKSATKMHFEMQAPATKVIPFPTSSINIYIQHQMISSSLPTRLHEQFSNNDYWEYLETKYKWTKATRQSIAWDLYHQRLNQHTTKQHQQLMKYTNGWLLTGHYVHRHDNTEDHRCPHCFTVQEKDQHILRCPHPERNAKRQRFLTVTLTNFYHTSNTAQPLRELISQNIIQWFRNPQGQHRMPITHPLYHQSLQQQAIGWQHFLQGRIANSLLDYQENYYRERERPETDTGKSGPKS
jgi:hypothetical protein